MSKIEVDKVDPQSGTALEIGTSGDTVTVPTGAGLTVVDEVKTNKISPATGVAFTLGDSGDTFTVPSGATITNSGTATGFGGGKINQVITATDVTQRTTTSTSFVTGSNTLSATITPSASDSKIFIIASSSGQNNTASAYSYYTLYRDATNLGDATDGMTVVQQEAGSNNVKFSIALSNLDSPASTSAIVYQLYMRCGSGTAVLNSEGVLGSITVMEVLA